MKATISILLAITIISAFLALCIFRPLVMCTIALVAACAIVFLPIIVILAFIIYESVFNR